MIPFPIAAAVKHADWRGFLAITIGYSITSLVVAWAVPVPKIRLAFHGVAALTYALGTFIYISNVI